MKTLNNYLVNDALYQGGTGPEAQVGDTVTMYLDTEAHPGFDESILGIIQHPIVKIKCGTVTSYSIEYDEADLNGEVAFLVVDDVIDAEITSDSDAIYAAIEAEEAARIAADLVLQGNIDDEETTRIAGDLFLREYIDAAPINKFFNGDQGIYQKIVISGLAGSEIITIENY